MRNTHGFIAGWLGISLLVLLGTGGTTLAAQTPAVPSDRLGWTQDASATEIAQLSFAVFIDGTRQALATVGCVVRAAGVYDCEAPFPAMTPGTHTLTVIAIRNTGSIIVESQPSAPFAVVLVVVVSPRDLRIVR